MNARSVQPEWCLQLPLQQQSVLMLAARGPDGAAKAHPCKDVVRAYRGTVLKAARLGRSLEYGEHSDTFMSLEHFGSKLMWAEDVSNFFAHVDSLPHHYYMHLMHGAEILGYQHPDARFRKRWHAFYLACCEDLHLHFESYDQLMNRLADWHQTDWEEK